MLHTLDCPHCRQAINVEESITRQIEQQVLHRIQHQQADQMAIVQRQAAELQRREAELQQAIATQQSQVSELVQIQSTTLRQQLIKQLREEQSGQLAALHEELAEKSAKVQELSKREGDLLRQQRALEEQRASIDGLVEKRVRAERNQIEMLALQKARDEGQFSLDQQQGLINSLRDQLAAMKRKIEQGSQQAQGEIMEVALEQLLADTFPFDTIQEVVKGQNGADIIQDVRNEFGRPCGRVIYESKRTKQFSVAWIDKLKADQQAHKGDIAVLVTGAMPKDLPHFGLYNGVYVCSFGEAKAVASLLREGVIRVGEAQVAGENKGGKMQSLYDYLTGNEFRQCMESMLRSFLALKANLDREKRAMRKLWAEREKQIESVMDNTTCLIGHVKGIAGCAVANLPDLELLAEEDALLLS